MSNRAKLDKIDRHILADLQADGRMTNVDLAKRAGISAPPCLRRVRALEKAGVVRGYHADIAPEALGFTVTVFALVGLNSQAEADLKAFEGLMGSWPNVRECHMLAGEADFLVKIVAEDWDHYRVPDDAAHLGAECQPREVADGPPHCWVRTRRADRRRIGSLPCWPRSRPSGGETSRIWCSPACCFPWPSGWNRPARAKGPISGAGYMLAIILWFVASLASFGVNGVLFFVGLSNKRPVIKEIIGVALPFVVVALVLGLEGLFV